MNYIWRKEVNCKFGRAAIFARVAGYQKQFLSFVFEAANALLSADSRPKCAPWLTVTKVGLMVREATDKGNHDEYGRSGAKGGGGLLKQMDWWKFGRDIKTTSLMWINVSSLMRRISFVEGVPRGRTNCSFSLFSITSVSFLFCLVH